LWIKAFNEVMEFLAVGGRKGLKIANYPLDEAPCGRFLIERCDDGGGDDMLHGGGEYIAVLFLEMAVEGSRRASATVNLGTVIALIAAVGKECCMIPDLG